MYLYFSTDAVFVFRVFGVGVGVVFVWVTVLVFI